MSPRRPWKLYVLAVFCIGLVAAIWFYRDDKKPDAVSQWAMPETVPAVSGNVKDPFPQPTKVLTQEEIRTGKWGPETSPSAENSETPETVDKQDQ